MTIWQHTGSTEYHKAKDILYLCFRGCQHFPEPFEKAGCETREHWVRVDPWKKHRAQPRLKGRIKT